MHPIEVVICDDHSEFREGLRALLASVDTVRVVGQAANGAEAISLAAQLQPDVILMDLHMPGMNGVEATRRIVTASPHIAIAVLTMVDDDDSVFAAMRSGARGYLLKGARRADIVRVIHTVADGQAMFGAGVAQRLMGYFASPSRPNTEQAFPQLTSRESEILALMAKHLTNPEIAKQLHLSAKTVRNNVSNIFTKLQVADRAQAIIAARDAGLQ